MGSRSSGSVAGVLVAVSCALAACVTAGTTCPDGTALARRIYSGGGETEWCRRPDGARQGPERRYYESGVELASGEYVDGAQSGVWRYRFNNGRNWRAERWEDGALIATTIDPTVAHMSPDALAALGPTSSGIIKLASHDPLSGSATREAPGATFISRFPSGRPQVAGSYDALGLRTGIWRFWFEDGRPARELEFLGGVRQGAARQWHPSGTQAAEGFYVAGLRDGRWRFWDQRSQLTAEAVYRDGARVSAPATGGMLPHEP
jgi:antitoxin component YwqK of YwqJK toxin-antitoxin module